MLRPPLASLSGEAPATAPRLSRCSQRRVEPPTRPLPPTTRTLMAGEQGFGIT